MTPTMAAMPISDAQLSDARARLERGASLAAVARFVGAEPDELRRALAPKLVPVHVVDVGQRVVVTAGPLRIEGLAIEDIARLVALCSG